MHPRRPLFALIGCSLLFTACTPPEPTPTPTPTPEPTYQCTPIFGGDPTTCTQQHYDDLQAELARYAEAEDLYRESVRETWELAAAQKPASDTLLSTATGTYVESIRRSLDLIRDDDIGVTGQPVLEWSKPADLSNEGSDFAIAVCMAPGTLEFTEDGITVPSGWTMEEVFFKKADGNLAISSVIAKGSDEC